MSDDPAIEIADVEAAAVRIAPFARRTPIIESTLLSSIVDAQVFCKAESLQRTGSFKFRGATNAIAALTDDERATGVITYSSGNHGQAISRAAGLHGCAATVVMPSDAPAMKRAATEHWGAKIVEYDRYTEDRPTVAAAVQADLGGVVIPPFDHRNVMAGQGTTALELFDDVADLDMLFVCLGGGGLLAGCSTVAKALNPNIIVVGVEPEAGDDHLQSRAAGKRVTLPEVPRTIADGQQTTAPGELTWSVTNRRADVFTTVTDDEIIASMRLLFEHHKLVVEPSGASALAAVLNRGLVEPGMRVGVTLSGGNIDLETFAKLTR
ncbi:MAG: threonine dehydratase [Verrucomicrobiales bacterium]|jgi:threonine dehydratase